MRSSLEAVSLLLHWVTKYFLAFLNLARAYIPSSSQTRESRHHGIRLHFWPA